MRRIFAILLLILVAFTATAQVEHSIILDAQSFRAVQTDALTGVNIDPIALDISRDACSRVKIRFANMSKSEIEALDIKFRSNTDLAKRKVADYHDNILILEMTAKPNTRFYVTHPEYGESNEVVLNLEANREYELEANLNQTYSIVVNSNVEGAEIFLNGTFKGRTNESCSLTISEVIIGSHTLKVSYRGISQEQRIEVSKNSISFRQNIDTEASKPQYVVFAVEPHNAIVIIENNPYSLQDGAMQIVLENGTYNFTVSAAGYHSQSGTFTVAGAKVEKVISLKENSASISITAPDNAEIWINGTKRGNGYWSNTLPAGTYIVEARKSGYKSSSISINVSSERSMQNYTLPAPTPITGSILVSGTPIMADISLDGKAVGRTPLELNNILIGQHTITASKSGYNSHTQTVTVAEGKNTTVNIALTKQSAQTTSTTTKPTSSQPAATKPMAKSGNITSAPYKVGDYYNDGKKEGVVFQVSSDGHSGKIVSMKQVSREQKDAKGWCRTLGTAWLLPSKEELLRIYNGRKSINTKLTDKISNQWYWSSSTYDSACDYVVNIESGKISHLTKQNKCYVRAIAHFKAEASATYTSTITSAPYKVGDYYNDGQKQGIVFETWDSGRSGKIVSLTQGSLGMQELSAWGNSNSEITTFIGADNHTDGMANMKVVQSRPDWEKNYPVFKWCNDLGTGWYLPAIDELVKITSDDALYQKINNTLQTIGKTPLHAKGSKTLYISSTECDYAEALTRKSLYEYSYRYSCWYLPLAINEARFTAKTSLLYGDVRAVAVFGNPTSFTRIVTPIISVRKKTKAPYKVGDYYNENGKEGVVFEISANGYHGKIIALNKIESKAWCNNKKELKKSINTNSTSDGEQNMRAVQQRKNWRENYPAFAACVDFGEGWYIPAIDELATIFNIQHKIDQTLKSKKLEQLYIETTLGVRALSSTESKSSGDIWYYDLHSVAKSSTIAKSLTGTIFPVAKF